MSSADGDLTLRSLASAESVDGAMGGVGAPLRVEGVSRFLEVSRSNFIVEPIASLPFAIGLWQISDQRQIGLWLALVWAAAVLRALLSLHIRRMDLSGESLREWGFAVSAATCLTGGLWASGLLFLWPLEGGSLGFFLIVAIMAVAGIVMVIVACHAAALGQYLLVTSTVAAIILIWQQPTDYGIAVMVLSAMSLNLAALARISQTP